MIPRSESLTSDERAVAGFRGEVKAALQEERGRIPTLTEAILTSMGERFARDYSRTLIEDARTAAEKEREDRSSSVELNDEIAVYNAALKSTE